MKSTFTILKEFIRVILGLVQNGILAIVFVAGWLLGGSIGIGTILSVFVTGIVMEAVFKIMKFEPRKVKHRSFIEATKMLVGKA